MTHSYKPDYTCYGGDVDVDDFNTYFPSKMALSKQEDAIKFDMEMKRKKKEKEELKKYLGLSCETLREMGILSNTDGRPVSSLTDEKWQKEFAIRKALIPEDVGKNIGKRLKASMSTEPLKWNEETQGTYHGTTNWQQYCAFINDILRNIESGQIDYCYFIYQILDLLKFHRNDLKTKYINGYWEVWLDK